MGDTRPVRAGEEIDLARLNSFLALEVSKLPAVVAVEQFPGGFSNLTYLLRTRGGELVLRRAPHGVAKGTAHDMAREYCILGVLGAKGIPAPRPVVLCEDDSILGTPFYVMERVRGLILRGTPREAPSAEAMRRLSESFVDVLVSIHETDSGDPAVAALGKPGGYVARQVRGWGKRWEASRTSALPAMDRTAAWLDAHQPADSAETLVHNDFKYDNLVLDPADPSRVVAVLDWEMATVGDPLLDVGTSLAYWVESADHPAFLSLGLGATSLAGNFTREELWTRYLQKSDRALTDPTFYYAFGLFKVAVIAQQIYFRFRQGLTTDERFAGLGDVVMLLGRAAEDVIARRCITPLRAGPS